MKKLILLVPFLFILGGIPLANRIHPQVFGFPFVLFWIVLGTLLASLSLFLVYHLEKKKGDERA